MVAYMPLARLMKLNVLALKHGGFEDAGTRAATGLDAFLQVQNAIAGGEIWTGAGQPEASMVLQNNTLALDVCRIQMGSAQTIMEGLSTALTNFRINLEPILDVLRSRGCTIYQDGTVVPPESTNQESSEVDSRAVRETLKLATLADLDANAALLAIAGNTPFLDDTADPGVQKHNQAALDQALDDAGRFRATADFWMMAMSVTLEQLQNGGANSGEGEKALDLAIKGIKAAGVNDYGLFDVMRGNWEAGRDGAMASFLTRFFVADGLPAVAKRLSVLGYLEFAGTIAIEIFAPPPQTTNVVTVDAGRGNKFQVLDPELADLLGGYYPEDENLHDGREGSGSIADLAHYQAMTGESAGDVDWVAAAEARRDDLQAWLDSHDDGYSDAGLARQLIADLDEALMHA